MGDEPGLPCKRRPLVLYREFVTLKGRVLDYLGGDNVGKRNDINF